MLMMANIRLATKSVASDEVEMLPAPMDVSPRHSMGIGHQPGRE
jgi:hypothetical protein